MMGGCVMLSQIQTRMLDIGITLWYNVIYIVRSVLVVLVNPDKPSGNSLGEKNGRS